MAAKWLPILAGPSVTLIVASAAWVTGGALAFTSFQSGASRVGILPSPVWLAFSLTAAGAIAASRARSRRLAILALAAVVFAPWLPRPVPAAFLIWAGPLRGWLWTALIAGVLLPAVVRKAPPALTRAARDPRRAPVLAAAVAAVAYLAGAHQISPQIPTGDEPHYLVITQSLLKDHDLAIENNHRRSDYLEYYAGQLKPDYLRRGIEGEIYSIHAPGLSVLVAPVFAGLGYAGVLGFLAIVSACATGLAWTATWRVTSNAGASWFGWAAVALGAPFFFQSFVVYPDASGAALVMVGVLALVDLDARRTVSPGAQTSSLSTSRLVATGMALAALPWLHTRYVAAAVMLALLVAARLFEPGRRGATGGRPARLLLALLSVPAVSATCWFLFFQVIYGSPDPRSPYGSAIQSDVANLPRGIVGLIFDQQFGVLPTAPVLLCAVLGLVAMVRRAGRLTAELLLLIAPYGFVVAGYQMWWGGNSSPGRFIIPMMLPLAIPAGVWYGSRRSVAAKLAGLGALTLSLLTTVTLAGVERGLLVYNFRDGSSRLLTWLSPVVNIATGFPSVFQTSPSAALVHSFVWLVAIALTVAAGMWVERRGAPAVGVALTLGFSAMVTASLALTVVWWDHGVSSSSTSAASAITPFASASALLERYDPDSRQIAIRYDPFRRVRARDAVAGLTLAEAQADASTGESLEVGVLHLPAGVYALEGTGGSAPLSVTADREFGPQWTWPVDESDTWRRELSLPLPLRAMVVKAPGSSRVAVRPVSITSARWLGHAEPENVVRYGPALVFLMGGRAFVERAGTWVEGGQSADFVISADAGSSPRLLVRNPPVANIVTLESEGWRESLVLSPGEERMIALPFRAGNRTMTLRVTAAKGARPTEFERGSTDTRFLGCWIETRS